MENNAYRIKVTGIVQGVGFRPFVYTLAKSLYLNGYVNNSSDGVIILIEGDSGALSAFIERLKNEAPPLSYVRSVDVQSEPCMGYGDFVIKHSTREGSENIYISPDVSICPDCQRELFDKNDRRYLYPFINCTNCGPRFTIVIGVPYDRINTTMGKFAMCGKCESEYGDPLDRRYHAQPVSCHDCGPKLKLLDGLGNKIETDDIMKYTRIKLLNGSIAAIKGLGGYHLVCDARNEDTVRELRLRKIRDDKPFALMVKDLDTAQKHCCINQFEKLLLESSKKPIVLLRRRGDCSLPAEIAPGNSGLGLMLPYTPVHLLLFHGEFELDTLVMTSANLSSEPICYRDDEALESLSGIADFFLTNDRDIFIRTDDSVTREFQGREYLIRRARGYVPSPVTCSVGNKLGINAAIPSVLACGGELKNTFCLNQGDEFYLSHHIGDLENCETLKSFEKGIEHFKKLFDIEYQAVAYDLHPEYLSTKYALALDVKSKIAVQHHHAHIASCMAENNLNEDVIGVAFDGTGYGEDGHIWGGEFFLGGYGGFKRAGHLDYVNMPGGEMAIKEPWRMAASYLHRLDGSLLNKMCSSGVKILDTEFLTDIEANKISAVIQMMEKNLNSPLTSSMGRLFDAAAALLGIRSRINYEGQAAVELEYLADEGSFGEYGFRTIDSDGVFKISMDDTIYGLIDDIKNGVIKRVIASKFHETIACVVLEGCRKISAGSGIKKIALIGGVFQNMTLLEKSVHKLKTAGFEVYVHSRVPSNDGGIALGQAAIAAFKSINTEKGLQEINS